VKSALRLLVLLAAVWLAQPASADQTDLLPGTWQTTHANGALEELSLMPLGSNGEGRMHIRQSTNGAVIWETAGFWRIRVNDLLPAALRVQLQLGWVDPAWGRKEQSLALREVSGTVLVLGSVYDERQTVIYQRLP